MPQRLLSDQYELDKSDSMTAMAGLPLYGDLFVAAGLLDGAREHLGLREQGWDDGTTLLSLVLLNIAGGDHVEDIDHLDADAALSEAMLRAKQLGMPRAKRRKIQRDWRQQWKRGRSDRQVPSATSILRWLYRFDDPRAIERAREEAQAAGRIAFVPEEHHGLTGLWRLNEMLLEFLQNRQPESTATLDMDATCIEADKDSALWCYKGFKGYQPLNVYWHEQDAIVYSQFRDGNVPAHSGQLEVLQRALDHLPDDIDRVSLRCDCAGYVWDLLRYCAEGKSERFGRIDFAVGADITPELVAEVTKLAATEWKRLMRHTEDGDLPTGQEFAEVVYVPNQASRKKYGPDYRFIVTREKARKGQDGAVQLALPGVGCADEATLPVDGEQALFKLYAVCTTKSGPAEEIIWWHRGRCGASEQAHTTMKRDLAGGVMPCDRFGANAAWWAVMLLAYNLNTAMRCVVLGGSWRHRKLKALRFNFIHVAGRIVHHAGQIRIKVGSTAHALLSRVRSRIFALAHPAPS